MSHPALRAFLSTHSAATPTDGNYSMRAWCRMLGQPARPAIRILGAPGMDLTAHAALFVASSVGNCHGNETIGDVQSLGVLARAVEQALDDDPWFAATMGMICERVLTGGSIPSNAIAPWDATEMVVRIHWRAREDADAARRHADLWLSSPCTASHEDLSHAPEIAWNLCDNGEWVWVELSRRLPVGFHPNECTSWTPDTVPSDIVDELRSTADSSLQQTLADWLQGRLGGIVERFGATTRIAVNDPAPWWRLLQHRPTWRGPARLELRRRILLSDRMAAPDHGYPQPHLIICSDAWLVQSAREALPPSEVADVHQLVWCAGAVADLRRAAGLTPAIASRR